MGNIRILDPEVVSHIAAGEVVDRPATLVKELIENALDAGAARIEIEILAGGTQLITVSDDGCGMDEGDAALSLQRHATSKLGEFRDLEIIRSYGFRGEALASIAAVSRLELITRQVESLEGTRVLVEGGDTKEIGPIGSPKGTKVSVHDLFFNVPARRKFLRSIQSEESACLELLGKMALASPGVAFQVRKERKILYTLPAGESIKDRALKLYPQTDPNDLFEIDHARDGVRIYGVLGAPLSGKTSRSAISLYVNRRVVRPGVLSQAVLDGYSGYLQPGRFPVTHLFLEIDGARVDVNVHPSKAEVRFSHPRDVYAFVEKSVAARLAEVQEGVRPRMVYAVGSSGAPSVYHAPSPKFEDLSLFESLAPYPVPENARPIFLSAIAKTYALFREGDTLFLADLHVAHERVNYDLLEARVNESTRPAQELLTPVMLQISPHHLSLVLKHADFLAKTGLCLEEFGADSILIRTIPLGLERFGEKRLLSSFIEKLERIEDVKGPEDTDRKILATLACRASVQAGDELSTLEMQSIFENVLKSSNPYFCPHGRPILVKLTLDEVHRLFRRTW